MEFSESYFCSCAVILARMQPFVLTHDTFPALLNRLIGWGSSPYSATFPPSCGFPSHSPAQHWHLCRLVPVQVQCCFTSTDLIIRMEICKAPTLRLKALNKHTHMMYIEMENVIKKEEKRYQHGFLNTMLEMHTHIQTHTHTHTHSHTHCTD